MLHETIEGDFKMQAVLSIPVFRNPGEMHNVYNKIDYMNLPNPSNNNPGEIIKEDLNVLDFIFDF